MRIFAALGVLAGLSLILVSALGNAAFGAELRFLTHSMSDSAIRVEGGFLEGKPHFGRRAFYVEVVNAMMAARGLHLPIEEVPLSRGIYLVGHESDYAFFNVIKNAARRDRFKWIGPISIFPTYFYEHASAPTGIQTVEDAKRVSSICVIRGNNLEQQMRDMGFANIFLANSNDACAQLLGYRRVSLIPDGRYPWFKADPRLADVIIRTPVVVSVDEGFIAVSPNVADAEIRAWQAALAGIRQSGQYDDLMRRYLLPPVPEDTPQP